MKIDYRITEYFEKNNLLNNTITNGLKIKNNNNTILISGSSIDLVNLADILVNIALNDNKETHIHIDNLTLLDKESDYKEIIIEKIGK